MSIALWKASKDAFGQALNFVALQLASPCHRCAEWAVHGLTPIRPGSFGNRSSYEGELASRVASCAIVLFFFPTTLSLWAAGGLIDKVGDAIKAKPYTYWQGEGELIGEQDSHTFFSLNACMLWGPLPLPFGGLAPARERVEALGRLILEQDADFVLLQEVSFGPAVGLYEQLKDNYVHFYTRIGPSPWLMMETALFVASKSPILGEPQYVPFSSGTMKRGLFCFETQKCWVLTTHLEAGSFQESGGVRGQQMHLILKTIRELKQKSNKPCFLAGDFNAARTGGDDDEYHRLQIPSYFYDACCNDDEVTASCTEQLSILRMGWDASNAADELIDYALIDEKPISINTTFIPTYQLDDPELALSDHWGLRTEVEFI